MLLEGWVPAYWKSVPKVIQTFGTRHVLENTKPRRRTPETSVIQTFGTRHVLECLKLCSGCSQFNLRIFQPFQHGCRNVAHQRVAHQFIHLHQSADGRAVNFHDLDRRCAAR